MTHDVLLARKDGSVRNFRVYGRPTPNAGDIIALPIHGQLIKARVGGKSSVPLQQSEMVQSANSTDDPEI
jgi:hypothetical protein